MLFWYTVCCLWQLAVHQADKNLHKHLYITVAGSFYPFIAVNVLHDAVLCADLC